MPSKYNGDQEIIDAIDQQKEKLKRPNVLVCGYTGTGKTSLMQKICGKEVVPDEHISHSAPATKTYVPYASDPIKFWDSQGLEPGDNEEVFIKSTKNFVKEKMENPDVDKHIHIVWYCIAAPSARVTPTDKELIKNVFKIENEIVLLTKEDIAKIEQINGMTGELVNDGVKQENILTTSEKDDDSTLKLINKTHEMLPVAYKDAFMAAQLLNLEAKKISAHAIIHGASTSAAAAGAIPIPGSDAPILAGIQTTMIGGLAILYGVYAEAMLASIGPRLAQMLGLLAASSLSKFIPGWGSVMQASVAASLTEALGWSVQAILERIAIARLEGREIPDFNIDPDAFQRMFEEFSAKK